MHCAYSFAQTEERSVLYGGHANRIATQGDNFLRIFMDKNGAYYPEDFIDNVQLKTAGSSLIDWSRNNVNEFCTISETYGLKFRSFSDQNFSQLQDSILQDNLNKLLAVDSSFRSTTLVIHGYGKPFETRLRETHSWSYDLLNDVKSNVDKSISNTFYLEVYWDAGYDCCFSGNIKKNKPQFQLFENYTSANAVRVGYNLRKLVAQLEHEQINLISHSAGAILSTCILFNAFPEQVDEAALRLKTPSQKRIKHCLIAPAIPSDPFEYYYDRNASLAYKNRDNYELSVFYNKQDYVLLKKDPKLLLVGPGPKKWGKTTLGCNHRKEISKLEEKFSLNYPHSKITNFEVTPKKTHSYLYYTATDCFRDWLKE